MLMRLLPWSVNLVDDPFGQRLATRHAHDHLGASAVPLPKGPTPTRKNRATKALRYRGGRIFLIGPNECAGAAVASEAKEHITRRR